MESKNQLTHDFLKWMMDNYGVRVTVKKDDAATFETMFPDLVAQLEKEEYNEATNNCS